MVGSADGITWSRVGGDLTRVSNSAPSRPFHFVTFGNGIFIAGSGGGYIFKSTDGIEWTEHSDDGEGDWFRDSWSSCTFAGGYFIATGGAHQNQSYYTTDGLSWTPEFLGAKGFNDVVEGGGIWVAVGDLSHVATRAQAALQVGPLNLVTTEVTNDRVALSWSPDEDACGYPVFWRQVGGEVWQQLPHPLPSHVLSVAFEELDPNTEYEFAIQTIYPDGVSNLSISQVRSFSGLEMWRLAQFGSTENSGNGANKFDFDHDGMSNLMEYAVGRNPKGSDTDAGVTTRIYKKSRWSPMYMEVSFWCDADKPDISYFVETSEDLKDWTRIAASIGGARTLSAPPNYPDIFDLFYNSGPRLRLVSVEDQKALNTNAGNQKGFIRLTVEER